MRCFRVDERSSVGITLSPTENGGLHIDLGDTSFPLQPGMEKTLLGLLREVVDRLGKAQMDDGDREVFSRIQSEWPKLLCADIVRGKVAPQRSSSNDALVMVETCAGDDGKVEYKGTVYTEKFDERTNRIERVYEGPFPPIGVEVIAEGKDHHGSRCMLLRMKPNASFRIERSGALEGESPVLTVIWTGGRSRRRGEDVQLPLLVVPPRRYQRSP